LNKLNQQHYNQEHHDLHSQEQLPKQFQDQFQWHKWNQQIQYYLHNSLQQKEAQHEQQLILMSLIQ